jgi:hypothetical protein
MMPNTMPPTANADSTVPPGSSPTCSPALVDGTASTMATSVTAAIAVATRKIEPHQNQRRSSPEPSSPSVPPPIAKPVQIPTARARFSAGKTLVMVDRVPGMISAAPTPMIAR